jgi:hypothetical protein
MEMSHINLPFISINTSINYKHNKGVKLAHNNVCVVARMREERKLYKVLAAKTDTTQEQRGVDGRMGSEWILGRLVGGVE